jgi:hypothetical protein
MIVYDEWPAQAQVIYFENYCNLQEGKRAYNMIRDFGLKDKKKRKKQTKKMQKVIH